MSLKKFLQLSIIPLLIFVHFYFYTNYPFLKIIFSATGSTLSKVTNISIIVIINLIILFLVYKKPKNQPAQDYNPSPGMIQKNNFLRVFFSFKTILVGIGIIFIIDFADTMTLGLGQSMINQVFGNSFIFFLVAMIVWAGILFLITNRKSRQ